MKNQKLNKLSDIDLLLIKSYKNIFESHIINNKRDIKNYVMRK